jgi:hypothetical protein
MMYSRTLRGAVCRFCLLVTTVTFGSSSDAFGQAGSNSPPRGQLEIDAAYRSTSRSLADSASPSVNIETATLGATYEIPAGMGFAASGAVRVWKRLLIGAGISRYSAEISSRASASLPHPFVFGRLRNIEGDVSGISREEMSLSMHARGLLPVSRRLSVTVFGGPAMLTTTQDVVTEINYTESYPYDSATFGDPQVTKARTTRWGLSAGADIAYFFSRQAGIGIGMKYGGGKIDLPSLDGGTIESKLGGLDLAAGVRLRF